MFKDKFKDCDCVGGLRTLHRKNKKEYTCLVCGKIKDKKNKQKPKK